MEHENATPHVFPNARRPGELLFAFLFLGFAVVLLSLIGEQTTWLKGRSFEAQPRTWPLVGLGGMVLFGLLHLYATSVSERTPGRWREAGLWLSSLEWVAYYLVYVFSISYAGYLFSTIVFCLFAVWRSGYRSARIYIAAFLFALGVVLFFKTALNVKIPPGAIYEVLPPALRNVMITYF